MTSGTFPLRVRGLHGSKSSYPNPEETRKYAATEPTLTRILFESGTRTRADPRNALNVLPGPDADPTIIRKLDPNPAGKTQTRLHPSQSAHIAQQMLLSQ